MKKIFCAFSVMCFFKIASAQLASNQTKLPQSTLFTVNGGTLPSKKKLYQHNYGAIIGIQRGAITSIELGAEAHCRKLSLFHPRIIGGTANFNYNIGHHTIGYQAGAWMKHGRVNLTYGANVLYYSDFKGLNKYGIGPAVGFRLAGFHLINGYNFLAGDKKLEGANNLYITLRYYFPVENKFTWDRKTMKKKKDRRKEKEKRRERRAKEKENGERKGILNLFS
jgi:hypothetical protein